MKIKTIQWNIGGGYVRKPDSDPSKASSYDTLDLDYFVKKIHEYSPTFITVQETHTSHNLIQTEYLANKLGIPYFHNDIYDKSHIEEGQMLGQGIISIFPFVSNTFDFYQNPLLEMVSDDGGKWISHNKGITKLSVNINDAILVVKTTHFVPFRKFGTSLNSIDMKKIRKDIVTKILPINKFELFQGDFNVDDESLRNALPEIFVNNMDEIKTSKPTTPKNRRYDHILFNGLKLIKSETIDNVLTDHFPIYTEFEL